jgi:hypothetical protein
MPTLPRTPTTSAGGLCVIGGADESAQIQSLTERVAKLEQALQYVLGEDISASQLSDISQNAGWVTGITYMGTPGWTRTAAGTLIPPPGFSLSGSGLFSMYDFCTGAQKDYQGVVMDEDGVLQFGFTPLGEMCGEKVEQWNGASAPDYYKYDYLSGIERISEGRNVTLGTNSLPGASTTGSLRVTVDNGGLWLAQASGYYLLTGGSFAGSSVNVVAGHSDLDGGPVGNPTLYHREDWNIQAIRTSGTAEFLDSQPTVQFNQSAIFQLDDSDRLTALLSVVGYPNLTGLTFTLTGADITFIRLGDGS